MRADHEVRYVHLQAHGASLMVPLVANESRDEQRGIMRANAAARLFLSSLKGTVSRETIQKRRYHLESFLTHLGGDTEVRAVKKAHIQNWLGGQEVSPSTLKLRFLTIRRFFDFCLERGWVKTVPYLGITLPRVAKKQPRALTKTELRAVAAVLPDERARLIVALALNEGLRRVEIARLELGDIDFQSMTVRVVTAKAGTEDIIPLTPVTLDDFLAPYLTVRGRKPGALIQSQAGSGGLAPDTIGMMMCRWLLEAGVKQAPFDGKSLHACRHSFAMNLLDHGADPTVIQAGLRHSTLGSTWTYLRGTRDVERLRPFMGQQIKEAS